MTSNRQYRMLAWIATLFQIVGVLIFGIATLIAGLLALAALSSTLSLIPPDTFGPDSPLNLHLPGIASAAGVLFLGGGYGIGLFVLGELIHLLREMALNLRESLEQQRAIAFFSRETSDLLRQLTGPSGNTSTNNVPPQTVRYNQNNG